jgi:lipopolysaccharide transport system ATP-binding protein
MNAVQSLCPKTLWLHKGQVEAFGPSRDVIARYLKVELSGKTWTTNGSPELANPYFTPTRMSIVDRQLRPFDREIGADEEVGVLIEGTAEQLNVALTVGFAMYATGGELLFWALHADVERERWPPIRLGLNRLVGWVPAHLLNEGDYRVDLHASLYFQEWLSRPGYTPASVGFRIQGGLSKSPYWMMARPGLLGPIIPFEALDVPKE